LQTQNRRNLTPGFAVLGLALLLSACGPEASSGAPDELGTVTGASSGSSGGGSTGTWPYPVPTGCVSISPTQCQTNVGHYDVTEAEQSLDANMAADGWTKRYSPVCRSNIGYNKGSINVCYRVGVVSDANFQAIGSQWSGFMG